jgi:ribosome-interacting GTPase 1
MPANLTPVYYEAERKYKTAKSLPERVAALQEMLAVMPKHKGTDHLQADLKARIAKLLDDLDKPTSGPKRTANPFNIRKEGAGQIALVGYANAGKSALLVKFTGATAKVASYSYTTLVPSLGMLPYGNIQIQLVDIPAIDAPETQTSVFGLLRNASLLALVVDLSSDPVNRATGLMSHLADWGFDLLDSPHQKDSEEDGQHRGKPIVLVGTKADIHGGLDGYQELEMAFKSKFPVVLTSANEGLGADDFADSIYGLLDVIRVYTKTPGQSAVLSNPLVLRRGSTIYDVAEDVHKDLLKGFKYALLWGSSGKFDGQRVGRDHQVSDGDVVELHV